uniref:DUF1840 domain-containing protein n=1 Tax=uncultured Thiotrichaceae bacterium TaxID=298394 RepID=A0A6S6ULS1_9GAMM|nr:MAG: Unknown protein [uncultured Thiotrichaceae bacterium]
MIRFDSEGNSGFSMFDGDAKQMLGFMRHSGSVPGAIRAEDIGVALGNLQDALKAAISDKTETSAGSATADKHNDEQEPPIDLGTRAYPLVQLLESAQSNQEAVRWDNDNSIV